MYMIWSFTQFCMYIETRRHTFSSHLCLPVVQPDSTCSVRTPNLSVTNIRHIQDSRFVLPDSICSVRNPNPSITNIGHIQDSHLVLPDSICSVRNPNTSITNIGHIQDSHLVSPDSIGNNSSQYLILGHSHPVLPNSIVSEHWPRLSKHSLSLTR